jgi:hypothetical protein
MEKAKNNKNITFVRTHSKVETGQKKWEYLQLTHLELRPAGENCFSDAAQGCIPVFTKSLSENEIRNTIWAAREHVGIISSYPKEHYKYWKRTILPLLSDPAFFNQGYENILDYLDNLFHDFVKIRDFITSAYYRQTQWAYSL